VLFLNVRTSTGSRPRAIRLFARGEDTHVCAGTPVGNWNGTWAPEDYKYPPARFIVNGSTGSRPGNCGPGREYEVVLKSKVRLRFKPRTIRKRLQDRVRAIRRRLVAFNLGRIVGEGSREMRRSWRKSNYARPFGVLSRMHSSFRTRGSARRAVALTPPVVSEARFVPAVPAEPIVDTIRHFM